MPRIQDECLMAIYRYLPEIAKQLKLANKLKVIEIKSASIGAGTGIPALLDDIDDEIDD